MHRDNGGSVKAFSQKKKKKKEKPQKNTANVSEAQRHLSQRAPLKPDALGGRRCQRKQRDEDVAEFYIRTDTKG